MEIYQYCTSTTFKKDISELCENCPIPGLIKEHLTSQIVHEATINKELLNQDQFQLYINDEIKNAMEAMRRVYLTEMQNKNYQKDPHRKKRIEIYLWNKERIKVLNEFLSNNSDSEKNFYPRIFKNEIGYNIFKNYQQHINERYVFVEYSFLYRILIKDDMIHENITPTEFVTWLNKQFDINIDTNLKTLDNCRTSKKMEVYNILKTQYKSPK